MDYTIISTIGSLLLILINLYRIRDIYSKQAKEQKRLNDLLESIKEYTQQNGKNWNQQNKQNRNIGTLMTLLDSSVQRMDKDHKTLKREVDSQQHSHESTRRPLPLPPEIVETLKSANITRPSQ